MAIPEEDLQGKFDQYVINALNVIHDEKVTPGLVERMKAGDPVNAIGDIAVDIAERLDATAEEKQYELKANTIMNGLNVIVGELSELAEAAGIEPLDPEEKYQAYSYALSRYLSDAVEQGKISPQDLQQMKQMLEAEEQGQKPQQPISQPQQQSMPQQPMPQGQPQQPMPQRQPQQRQPGILGGM